MRRGGLEDQAQLEPHPDFIVVIAQLPQSDSPMEMRLANGTLSFLNPPSDRLVLRCHSNSSFCVANSGTTVLQTTMLIHLSGWDAALILTVAVQSTAIAYLHSPAWKAFILTLPIPFMIATMAVGLPVDACNVWGLVLLLVFFHVARILYGRMQVPIVLAIVISALVYCGLGWGLARIVPRNDLHFWLACAVTWGLAVAILWFSDPREEPGHRSPLPVGLKFGIIAAVIFLLVQAKAALRGFVTMFPMVSIVAVYEARHSLWTMCRQVPVFTSIMIPMIIVCRLGQGPFGLLPALGLGWVVFLVLLWIKYRHALKGLTP